MNKEYKVERRKQPDGTSILVRTGRIKKSKYTRHQGEQEKERRMKDAIRHQSRTGTVEQNV